MTAVDAAEGGPVPPPLEADTTNVYAVPAVSPDDVVLVAGGEPLTVWGVCATPLIRGVTV
jgi:hypothetical protein